MVDSRQGVQLVQAGNDIAALDVRQPADMQHKLRTAAPRGKLVARRFHVAVSQAQSFTDLAQTQSGKHGILVGQETLGGIYSIELSFDWTSKVSCGPLAKSPTKPA